MIEIKAKIADCMIYDFVIAIFFVHFYTSVFDSNISYIIFTH